MKTATMLFLLVALTISLFAGEWDIQRVLLIFLSSLLGAIVWTAIIFGTTLLTKGLDHD